MRHLFSFLRSLCGGESWNNTLEGIERGGLYPSNIDHKNMACLDSVNYRNLEGSADEGFIMNKLFIHGHLSCFQVVFWSSAVGDCYNG